jgi:hypothetical protein
MTFTHWALLWVLVLAVAFACDLVIHFFRVRRAVNEILALRVKGKTDWYIAAIIWDKYGKSVHDCAWDRINAEENDDE